MKALTKLITSLVIIAISSSYAYADTNYFNNPSTHNMIVGYEFLNKNNPSDVTALKTITIPATAANAAMSSVDAGVSPDPTTAPPVHTILHVVSVSFDDGTSKTDFANYKACSRDTNAQLGDYDMTFTPALVAGGVPRITCTIGNG